MMPRLYLFTSILFFITLNTQAQNYPRQYFRHPMNIPMQLVANFGEIRANHWHMGLDIRTQQRVNIPVYAAAEGYVSRVVVEPGGFGQAIYIAHPNGLTTLYAHMNSFFPALATWVKSQQYDLQSWKVSLNPPPGLFNLNKGDFIGNSGNTGASQGPHVHFEIRNTQTEKCLNPLLFGFPIPDAVAPSITRLAMYDRNISTYHQSPQLLPLRRSGRDHVPSGGAIRSGSNRISFAIGAVDRFSGTPNPNGVYAARMMVDGKFVSGFKHDNIGYDETRYINAQLDLPYQSRGGGSLQHITPLPGATSVAYETRGDGSLQLNDTDPHEVVIEVSDANNNTSYIRFTVTYDPSLSKQYGAGSAVSRLLPNQVNIIELPNFELFTSEYSIYDTLNVAYSEAATTDAAGASGLHRFLSNAYPSHDSVTVRLRPTIELNAAQRNKLVIRNVSGSRTYVHRARWQNGWISAKFRQFGTYQAFLDEEPPTVNAPPSNLSRSSSLVFVPKDNFNTIRSFRAELDGAWLRFSNDKGRSWIYSFDEHFPRGTHQLRLIIEDEAGNVMDRTWTVTR